MDRSMDRGLYTWVLDQPHESSRFWTEVFLVVPTARPGELLKTEGLKPHVLLDSLKALVWRLKHVHICLVVYGQTYF